MAIAVSAVISLQARELRITTWTLNKVSESPDTSPTAETEEALIQRVAGVLSATRSDVIVLRDVRDRQVCQRIAERLTGGSFGVVACSDFSRGSTGSPTQVAILSKSPAFSAWTESWKLENNPEVAGGFAFAGVRVDDSDVCIYALQLPALIRKENPDTEVPGKPADYDALVQQVIQHAAAAGNRGNARTTAFVVSGELAAATPEGTVVRQGVLRSLEEGGLQEIPDGREPTARDGSAFLFVRNVTPVRPATEAGSGLVTHVLNIAPTVPLTNNRDEPRETFGRTTRVLLWSGLALGIILIAVAATYGARAIARLRIPGVEPVSSSEGNLSTAVTRTTYVNRLATEASPQGEVIAAPTETASSDVPIWRQRTLRTEPRPDDSAAADRDRLMPHLARMMKDKLLWRLLAQRSQTIQIHEASARVVAELEQRLALIQNQFESRVQAYENRIAELERELAEKETITRELLESRIQVARLAVEQEQEETPAPKPSVVYTLRFGDLMARKSTVRTQSRQKPERN